MYKAVLKRKERITIAAIDLFDEAGINGLTTKEIANRQNITEPAVYKQFSSKKEIVTAILDRYANFDDEIKNTIVDNEMTGRAGIEYFVNSYTEYYQNYPQITTAMFSFDMFRYDAQLHEKMTEIMKKRYQVLFFLVTEAKEKNQFSRDIDVQAMTDAVFGIICSTTFMWKLDGCQFDLKQRVMKGIKCIFGS
ncbi:TetR/AcrR family transcriptional regulator [Pelosinus propionicus]|uniref:DNA-binding transcriptional regulator, AcrR family n=1 Tax=Pelosinus propionicus DSM 13327 TaxID=1123291 RepID=A0A1I4KG57_9FIRM|nr:TetR/AcrR family transcriptional regulator [Pelosinus propionicus]SFL77754.1 DNA-binding transcriptional regulator, AcrR family [Pelosinus propionicus DSM 13327]